MLALLFVSNAVAQDVIVQTTLGPIRGYVESPTEANASINVFRAVPFAADTGGNNRFLPPQPRQPWLDVLNCTLNGPGCRQPHHNADVPCGGKQGARCQSEDCLNLNLYCPSVPPSQAGFPQGYPTIFWIYGGAFNEGMNWGPLGIYDGSQLSARGGVCVVATNYRLGVLGFLVSKDQPGNQAILDQRMAMQWTQENIAKFGGNPVSYNLVWTIGSGVFWRRYFISISVCLEISCFDVLCQ